MKGSLVLLSVSGAAIASPHAHHHVHRHVHAQHEKRATVEEHISVTVVECWMGQPPALISEHDCQNGIANGTLRWADDGTVEVAQPSTHVNILPDATPAPIAKPAVVDSPPPPAPAKVEAPPPPPPVAAAPAPAINNKAQSSWAGSSAAMVDRSFPDGQIPCSEFPEEFGALRAPWLGLGGWVGVQKPNVQNGAGYDDIMTVTKSQCVGDNCCLNEAFCSYACPDGYMKTQWPSVQGATGQSVGGLLCRNGMLHRSNPAQQTLCQTGVSNVNVYVKNQLGSNVAVCRTNYPGDENMSLPTDAQPGTMKKIPCPDQSTWKWLGQKTSAQYYINLPGYSVEQACRWGSPGSDFGNFAPGVLGVGYDNGRAWVSIQANTPTQMNVKLPYTIELQGDSLSDTCRYQGGQYCQGRNYDRCNPQGCTVSAGSGDIYYVIS